MKLTDQVVLITGASSGIGKAIAKEVAAKGGTPILVARSAEVLHQLANELKADYHTSAYVIVADLTQSTDIERVVKQAIEYCGRIDILVNSAGYGEFKRATAFTYTEIEAMFRLNTFAMMYLSQLVALQMSEQPTQGKIYFLASIAGKIATPASSVYSATKFAVIGYANALRMELKPLGIQVTTINPGPVATLFFERDTQSRKYYERVQRFALDPNRLAQKVVNSMTYPVILREMNIPFPMALAAHLTQLLPRLSEYVTLNVFNYKEEPK